VARIARKLLYTGHGKITDTLNVLFKTSWCQQTFYVALWLQFYATCSIRCCYAQHHMLFCDTSAVAQLVKELRYKLEGRGFDFWWCQWNFSLT
jgi:hypothetical protein